MRVLFTKKLTDNQKEKLNFSIDDFNFITIKQLPFSTSLSPRKHFIFTSRNAVKSFCKKYTLKIAQSIYAVGKKTKEELLLYSDFQNIRIPENEENSVGVIQLIEQEKSDDFLYICGKKRLPMKRLPILEHYFEKNNKNYEILEVYDTVLSPTENLQVENYDYLCFCSPSAVESYLTAYEIFPKHKILCIGKTTAKSLYSYTRNLEIAPQAFVESMLRYLIEKQ